ncbi:DUF947-domain-containing protein [Ramaria rubella]|nr:DUF947-domain-containing protein [Ramaria rubella]
MPQAVRPRFSDVSGGKKKIGQTSSDLRHSVDDESVAASYDEQPDVPRVAQWVDDEEFEDESTTSTESEEQGSGLETLKRDLSKLPLGALIKARKEIKIVAQDSDNEESQTSDSQQAFGPGINGEKNNASGSTSIGRRVIQHRFNKHAPMEVTSKKPVTRRRQVVEVHQVRPRDPRFSDLSGPLSIDKFHTHYDFLPGLHTGELAELKQTWARARKLLISSPQHLRAEREEEVHKLEQAIKRAESTVNREKREEAERQALRKFKQEEREKRKAGKKAWYLKDADKNAIRVRARLEAIEASGGKRAVKKAIEKKQKKVGQREKKSRPFAATGRGDSSRKRRSAEGEGRERRFKRPRVDH